MDTTSPIDTASNEVSGAQPMARIQTVKESTSTSIVPGAESAAVKAPTQAERPEPPNQYKPSLRTKFTGKTHFTTYYMGKVGSGNPETLPALDLTIRRKESIEKLDRATPLPVNNEFRVLPFRSEGTPLVLRNWTVGVPSLTSNVSDGCCVWLCATNASGTRGIHSLLQITASNVDGALAIRQETGYLQALGFKKLLSAQVAGAFNRTLQSAFPVSRLAPKKACDAAQVLVDCVSELGYESVTDLTRENFPDHMASDRTMGGKMIEEGGRAVFIPIGWGIFEGEDQRPGARQGLSLARDPDRQIN